MENKAKPPKIRLDDLKDSLIQLIVSNDYYKKEYGYDFLKTHDITIENLQSLSIDDLFMWDYIKTCEIQNLIWETRNKLSQRNTERLIPNDVRKAMKMIEDINIIYAKSETCLETHMKYTDKIKELSKPHFNVIADHLKTLSCEELLGLIRAINQEALQGTDTPQGLDYLSYGAVGRVRDIARQHDIDLDIANSIEQDEDEEEL